MTIQYCSDKCKKKHWVDKHNTECVFKVEASSHIFYPALDFFERNTDNMIFNGIETKEVEGNVIDIVSVRADKSKTADKSRNDILKTWPSHHLYMRCMVGGKCTIASTALAMLLQKRKILRQLKPNKQWLKGLSILDIDMKTEHRISDISEYQIMMAVVYMRADTTTNNRFLWLKFGHNDYDYVGDKIHNLVVLRPNSYKNNKLWVIDPTSIQYQPYSPTTTAPPTPPNIVTLYNNMDDFKKTYSGRIAYFEPLRNFINQLYLSQSSGDATSKDAIQFFIPTLMKHVQSYRPWCEDL